LTNINFYVIIKWVFDRITTLLGARAMARILIVDDETSILDLLNCFLGLSHEVKSACDAKQALTVLDSFPADLAIVDTNMPGMSGAELVDVLRERGMKTVLTSGLPPVRNNANAFVPKPFDLAFLMRTVERVLAE